MTLGIPALAELAAAVVGSWPLPRAGLDRVSASSHVHGDFHAETKLGSRRGFPFHVYVLSSRK